MNEKQIILAMLDIEYIFEEYQDKIDMLLEKKEMIEDRLELIDINNNSFEQLYNIFGDIYDALDN